LITPLDDWTRGRIARVRSPLSAWAWEVHDDSLVAHPGSVLGYGNEPGSITPTVPLGCVSRETASTLGAQRAEMSSTEFRGVLEG
jgi:hypothetical protein